MRKFISELEWERGNSLMGDEWVKKANVSVGDNIVLSPESNPYNDMRSVHYEDSAKVWTIWFSGEITLKHLRTGDLITLKPTSEGKYQKV